MSGAYTRATDAQMRLLGRLLDERAIDAAQRADIVRRSESMTKAQASGMINYLMQRPRVTDLAPCGACGRVVTVQGGTLLAHGTIDGGACAGSGMKQ